MQMVIGVLSMVFGVLVFFGIPAASIVFFIIYLVKYKKCSPDETEKKKTFKTCSIVFGVMGGVYIISVIIEILLFSASIAYM
ncbi:MAG: hypothetical protein ACI4SF_09165 [Oscillospiraceae bacterium]